MIAGVDFVAACGGVETRVVCGGDAVYGGDGFTGIEVLGQGVVDGEAPIDLSGMLGTLNDSLKSGFQIEVR